MSITDLRQFAEHLATEAGRITLRWFNKPIDVERKADESPVTAADRASEQYIRAEIEKRFPDDGILGEEYGEKPGTSGRRWIIDPIDGTKSFIRGVPLYGTMIAVEIDGRHDVGVIGYPGTGQLISAHTGGGCTLDGQPCRVSATADLAEAFACTTAIENWVDKLGAASLERLARQTKLSRTWGDCYGYMLLASGKIDVMIDPIVEVHDYAALVPIITEAGGRITDFEGKTPSGQSPVAATNGPLHDAVLAMLHG